jgi:putative membrane protein insertion efficiency factor
VNVFVKFFVTLITGMIRTYQWTLSAVAGPMCRFEPTCSAYTEQAVRCYGPISGLWLGLQRLARCHPWSPGGEDPVPERLGNRHDHVTRGRTGRCGG